MGVRFCWTAVRYQPRHEPDRQPYTIGDAKPLMGGRGHLDVFGDNRYDGGRSKYRSVESSMTDIKKRMVYLIACLVVLSPVIALSALSALATKSKNLGVNHGRLAPCPNSPNCVSTQDADSQHTIEAIVFEGAPEDAMRKLKAVIAAIPRMEIITETDSYLHAEATSLFFRFRDDVEFVIDGQAKLIHFRSASRVGHSDLGANRTRMERIRQAFDQT